MTKMREKFYHGNSLFFRPKANHVKKKKDCPFLEFLFFYFCDFNMVSTKEKIEVY